MVFDHVDRNVRGGTFDLIATACYYCYYMYKDVITVVEILRSILEQLLRDLPQVPPRITRKLGTMQKSSRNMDEEDVLTVLRLIIEHCSQTFICIDALDEVPKKTGVDLLEKLATLHKAHIFITSRTHLEAELRNFIMEAMGTTGTNDCRMNEYLYPIKANKADIEEYLADEIEKDLRLYPTAMNPELRTQILKEISEKAAAMQVFCGNLWLKLERTEK